MDRSVEFLQVAGLLGGGRVSAAAPRQRSAFSESADRVREGLSGQKRRIAHLKTLTARRGIFDDPASEIEQVSAAFKQQLRQLDAAVGALEQQAGGMGGRGSQRGRHCGAVAAALRRALAAQAGELQSVLVHRTEVIKQKESRRSKFAHAGAAPVPVALHSPLFAPAPSAAPSAAPAEQHQQLPATSGVVRRRPAPAPQPAPQGPGMMQQAQMQLAGPAQAQAQAQGGRSEVHLVESTIGELRGMFTKMTTLISAQGELVTRIDDDLEAASVSVEGAQAELSKAFLELSGQRGMILKIFAVLLVFVVLVVVVMR